MKARLAARSFRGGRSREISGLPDFVSDLDFLTLKLDDRITFTRASANATYFDGNGILQTAGTNIPRFDHDPSNNSSLGLRIEGAGTNICLQSEDLTTTWSSVDDTTITANQAIAPDGNMTADEIEHTTSAASFTQSGITVTADTIYTLSWHLEVNDNQWIRAMWTTGALTSGVRLWFDVANGVLGTVAAIGTGTLTDSGFIDVGGGRYRVWIAGKIDAASTSGTIFYANQTGNNSVTEATGVSGYGWGADLKLGSFPSSYVMTTTGSAARSADTASMALSDIPGFDGAAFTWLAKGRTAAGQAGAQQVLGILDDGSTDNRALIQRDSNGDMRVIVVSGTATVASMVAGNVADDTDFAIAVRVEANSFGVSLDGAAVVSDTVGAAPIGLTTKRFGRNTTGFHWFGTIARDTMWNEGLPDSQLQAITG